MEIALRPLMLLVLLAIACALSWLIKPLIPEGRVKSFLYRKHFIVPPNTQEPSRDQRPLRHGSRTAR